MIKKIFQNIFYIIAILCMVLVIAWGGSWLFQAIRDQLTKLMS